MNRWSDGVYLLGRSWWSDVGCWLLSNGKEGAIVECPPYNQQGNSPAEFASRAAQQAGLHVRYLLCTHFHSDHFSLATLRELASTFPQAEIVLADRFRERTIHQINARFFDDILRLSLDGEPLYLIHAPKHSWSDTVVIFRGVAVTGDWELNTLRSVNAEVSIDQKLKSIDKMVNFPGIYNYRIHKVFSAHANDRRENVDWALLMSDTKVDRKLW